MPNITQSVNFDVTSSCPGLPQPTNTKLPYLLVDSLGNNPDDENWIVSCKNPNTDYDKMTTKLLTKTISGGLKSITVNFHFFCGKFQNCLGLVCSAQPEKTRASIKISI